MLDPSCSGSGMLSRLDSLLDEGQTSDPERLAHLSQFQIRALLHAFSFPKVKKVAYSTCSIHKEENEHVVKAGLDQAGHLFTLSPGVLPQWTRRGLDGILPKGKSDSVFSLSVLCFLIKLSLSLSVCVDDAV